MRKSRARFALTALAVFVPAMAGAAEDNPFVPPEPSRPVDEARVREIVLQVLDEIQLPGPGGIGVDATIPEHAPWDAGRPDPTVGATLIACVGGQGLWREQAGDGGMSGGAPTSGAESPAVNQDVKFGVTFYATPRPPLRNPCAE